MRGINEGIGSQGKKQKVLFLLMPWAGVRGGALGIGTLQAVLERDGIAADARYLNIPFARSIGLDLYSFISERGGGKYRGEVFFTPYFFDLDIAEFIRSTLQNYYGDVLTVIGHTLGVAARGGTQADFLRISERICRERVPSFLEECMRTIDWHNYDIVGFSLMFDQTLASLCLAKQLKEAQPDKIILFGGASCESDMGVEMLRAFPCVDVVATGESDEIITPLVRALRVGGTLAGIPGIAYREGSKIAYSPSIPVQNLDSLPYPDYRNYMEEIGGKDDFVPGIYFETSRGCWWGQKHLCSFCGLNANGLSFRRKTPHRAVQEILGLAKQYGVTKLNAADNILDMNYFKEVIPALREANAKLPRQKRVSIFYETKSNLKKTHLVALRDAGIDELQPGIESFNDHILALMKKGATAIQQIQFVKWATELDLKITYGILHDNPGERAQDYVEMGALIEFVDHLLPPRYITPVVLDRFSPYYKSPLDFGVVNVRPQESYRQIFPDNRINIERLAYRFSYDHVDRNNPELRRAVDGCVARLEQWRDNYKPDTLVYQRADSGIHIIDRRANPFTVTRLHDAQAEIFLYCDEIHSFAEMRHAWADIEETVLQSFLQLLIARKWMYCDGRGHYISLPIDRSEARLFTEARPPAGFELAVR